MMTTEEWDGCISSVSSAEMGAHSQERPISRRSGIRDLWSAPMTTTVAWPACGQRFK